MFETLRTASDERKAVSAAQKIVKSYSAQTYATHTVHHGHVTVHQNKVKRQTGLRDGLAGGFPVLGKLDVRT